MFSCRKTKLTFISKWAANSLQKTSDEVSFSESFGNVSDQIRIGLVINYIRATFSNIPNMRSDRSLLVLHYNTHVVKYLTFDVFKKLIAEMILLLKKRQELFGSNAQIVWKTMTPIGYKGAYYGFSGIYHTAYVSIRYLKQIYTARFSEYQITGINLINFTQYSSCLKPL